MEIEFEPKSGLKMKIQGENQKELIRQMAAHTEILGQKKCGACGSEDIRWQVRNVESDKGGKKKQQFEYFELVCNSKGCRARLSFGSLNDGTDSLFPKRKDEEGNYLANDGWVKFQPNTKKETKESDGEVGF